MSNGKPSFLDHMFVSDSIRQDILHAEVHDTGVNLSDHIPVIYKFQWSLNCHKQLHNTHKVVKQYAWRWDKWNLDYYYHGTNNNLMLLLLQIFGNVTLIALALAIL